jgi:hypothetical protein
LDRWTTAKKLFCYADNGSASAERFVKVGSQARMIPVSQPDITVDDDDSGASSSLLSPFFVCPSACVHFRPTFDVRIHLVFGVVPHMNQPMRKRKKTTHTPGFCTRELALNSSVHSPSVGNGLRSLVWASDHAGSRLDDGGGLLRTGKYHKRNVCQHSSILAQDLSEGDL